MRLVVGGSRSVSPASTGSADTDCSSGYTTSLCVHKSVSTQTHRATTELELRCCLCEAPPEDQLTSAALNILSNTLLSLTPDMWRSSVWDQSVVSHRHTYLLDHLGDHEGALLVEDLGQNLQTRQDFVHLPVGKARQNHRVTVLKRDNVRPCGLARAQPCTVSISPIETFAGRHQRLVEVRQRAGALFDGLQVQGVAPLQVLMGDGAKAVSRGSATMNSGKG